MVQSYKKLIVWNKSIELVTQVYKVTHKFPKEELYALINQLRRCVVSIPSNIAEGYQRQSRKEYIQFLYISFGSCAELDTQLIIACNLGYLNKKELEEITQKVDEVGRMLNRLILSLKNPRP